jgi:hypothetical protein
MRVWREEERQAGGDTTLLGCSRCLYLLLLQEVYHATHQCFYSKRSMYLALFRLTDGEEGIEELEQWLRSVQVWRKGGVEATIFTRP